MEEQAGGGVVVVLRRDLRGTNRVVAGNFGEG